MIAKNHKLQDVFAEYRNNQGFVLASGWTGYQDILKLTYGSACKTPFQSKNPNYQWGVYIDCSQDEYTELETLLKMLLNVVCIQDELSQSFALGYHFHSSFEGEGRTQVGELVHKAKPYNKNVHQEHLDNAQILAVWFTSFMRRHPAYKFSDYVLAVPPKDGKGFNLPTFIADKICKELELNNGSSFVSKKSGSSSQKDVDIENREENIKNAFVLSPKHPFADKVVTIIDDIYDTGSTINELGRILRDAGATVQGLTGTRINRRSYNDTP